MEIERPDIWTAACRSGAGDARLADVLYKLGCAWLDPNSDAWRLDAPVSCLMFAWRDRVRPWPARADLARAWQAQLSEAGSPAARALPVESLYEPWTLDPACTLPFARDKGLLQGDAALHMRSVLGRLGADAAGLAPDHLAVELNVAALLLEADRGAAARFARDHLAWIGAFGERAASVFPDTPAACAYLALIAVTQHAAGALAQVVPGAGHAPP